MAHPTKPAHGSYDVAIVGGGMIGASVAWWLARDPAFAGRILVVERDPSFEFASTTHTNSCIRQQFGTAINVRVSRFGVEFIRNFRSFMADDAAPEIALRDFGYLYLAADEGFAAALGEAQALQAGLGAGTRMMTPADIAARWPFYATSDLVAGSHNPADEGYFDGATIFDWLRRKGRDLGVETVRAEVAGLARDGARVTGLILADGTEVSAGVTVNAAGPRAAQVAAMADIDLPVAPHRRFSFVFDAAERLPGDMPLTIDPSGVHVRPEGALYLAGCAPDPDTAVDPADFTMDHDLWEGHVWPALAHRIPAFERVKLMRWWVGHYAMNTLDRNAILGPWPGIDGFLLANGFSGHGLQQAPAVGRGIAEWIMHGEWRSLDLSPLAADRIVENRPLLERAVI